MDDTIFSYFSYASDSLKKSRSQKIERKFSKEKSLVRQRASSSSAEKPVFYKPIILGEEHNIYNVPAFLLKNAQELQEKGFRKVLIETHTMTEEKFKEDLEYIRSYIYPILKGRLQKILQYYAIPEEKSDEVMIFLLDDNISSALLYAGERKTKVDLEDRNGILQYISNLYGKAMCASVKEAFEVFADNPESILSFYQSDSQDMGDKYINLPTRSLTVIVVLSEKGFDLKNIDKGRDFLENFVQTHLETDVSEEEVIFSHESFTLREQGMIEEIQDITNKAEANAENIIAVMGSEHVINLQKYYPEIAVYCNINGVSYSPEGAIVTQDINFDDGLYGIFQPRNLDVPLIEPSAEVLEVLYRLTQKKSSSGAENANT